MKKNYITPSIQVISLDMESNCLLTTSTSVQIGNDDDTITESNFGTKILSTGHSSWQSADDDDED